MAVNINHISKSFGSAEIFRDFSLQLPDAGCVCLFGPSGSGKTTLLNLMAGLTPPDAGQISLPPGDPSVVFQEDRLLPWVSALENVQLVLEGNHDAKKAREQAMRWLKKMSLEEAAQKRPSELSGGMRRRVALARAFAFGGSFLLLDEPFSGIDAQIKNGLISLLSQIKKDKLIVLVTHYPEEAVRLADIIHIFSGSPIRIAKTIKVPNEAREDRSLSFALTQKLAAHAPAESQA